MWIILHDNYEQCKMSLLLCVIQNRLSKEEHVWTISDDRYKLYDYIVVESYNSYLSSYIVQVWRM